MSGRGRSLRRRGQVLCKRISSTDQRRSKWYSSRQSAMQTHQCNCIHIEDICRRPNHARRNVSIIFIDRVNASHPSSKHYRLSWNLGLFLILSPYLYKTTGSGHMASAINANSEFPHPYPSVAYIFCPAKGSRAPSRERRTVFAARAEAA